MEAHAWNKKKGLCFIKEITLIGSFRRVVQPSWINNDKKAWTGKLFWNEISLADAKQPFFDESWDLLIRNVGTIAVNHFQFLEWKILAGSE